MFWMTASNTPYSESRRVRKSDQQSGSAVFTTELVDPASSINNLLFTRVERMA